MLKNNFPIKNMLLLKDLTVISIVNSYLWRSGCELGSFVASNSGKNTLSNNCWKLSKILFDLNISL